MKKKKSEVMTTVNFGVLFTEELPLLDRIVREGNMVAEPSQSSYAKKLLGQLAVQVLEEGMYTGPGKSVVAAINERVVEIDRLLTDQVNAILHHPEFQRLESTWTGLHDMVCGTETGSRIKLRLLNVNKKDLLKDLEAAIDYDASALFKKVYEEEYGTFGGHPFSLLIGDYQFGHHLQDISLLEHIAKVAAAAHAPFIAAASPALFNMKSFTELGAPRDLAKIFESGELAAWRGFRDSEDSRYVALVLPSYAARLPYGNKTIPVESFDFKEDVDGTDHGKYLWANSAYQLGLRITEAFAKYSWTTAIRGVEGGGRVTGLVAHTFTTGEGDVTMKAPTEISITDRREKELNDLGFISLVHSKGSNFAAFFGNQTVNRPRLFNSDAANANAHLAARLPYILAASRFAHYLKVMVRDKVGSFQTRSDIEKHLNNWAADYVLLNPQASHDLKARHPLAAARVDVREVAGRPGSYQAVCFLKPHFQMEDLGVSIRLVADLPATVSSLRPLDIQKK